MSINQKFLPAPLDFPVDRPALVAVSGGRDSVSLLHWLASQGFRGLRVVHVNHGLRGAESDADAEFVAALAANYGLPADIASADVSSLAATRRLSIETAAREARLEAFAAAATRSGATDVFLAHHADDQAETVLYRLLRGSGIDGLAGMRPITTFRTVDGTSLTLRRPFLETSRAEIAAYAEGNSLEHREDASNASLEPVRNRLRHEIFPAIEAALGRPVRAALCRAATILAAEADWMAELSLPEHRMTELPVAAIRALPLAAQRRVLHKWLEWSNVPQVGFAEVEAVRGLLPVGTSVWKINLPGGRHARRKAGRIWIEA